jgi:hypothetical protein
MSDQAAQKPPRAILASIPGEYRLPGKPAGASPAVVDAHRQTMFLLGEEVTLFERTMSAVLSLIATAKPKGPRGAATLTIGGRVYAHLADACRLMFYGSYVSCPPLVRMALEATAVQVALQDDEFGPYEDWYQHAVTQEGAAVHIDLGHSKAASVLAADDNFGQLYRLLMDLSMPHFGSALLFAAPETSLQKAPIGFADNSFHLGLAQLTSGWLLQLASKQLEAWQTVPETPDGISSLLADKRRCYVESANGRWVFHNFRRSPSGQPKRVVLG